MKDYLEIGSVPSDEPCCGVGADNYYEMSRIECQVFKKQLKRIFGEGTENNSIVIKSFNHDFGSYSEVCVYFNDQDEESLDYAFKIEGECPENWDDEAIQDLKNAGYIFKK